MAPEVLNGECTEHADCWSMGVIIYMLLSSQMPFYAKRSQNMIAQITEAKYKMAGPVWESISNGAKHLVSHLLVVDPTKRYTAKQSLEHLWLRKWMERTDTAPSDDMIKAMDDSLQQYRHTSTLKKLALNVSALNLVVGLFCLGLSYEKQLLPSYSH